MTPYTSFASSSNGNPVDVVCGECGLDATCNWDEEGGAESSLTAITTPELGVNALRGVDVRLAGIPSMVGATARETPGRMPPPSTAGLGRLVRFQSW